jgi:hypothetical protein
MYELMAAELRVGHTRFASVHLHRNAMKVSGKADEYEDRIDLHWSAEIALPKVPTLIMDADFDLILAGRFFPIIEQVTVVGGKRRGLHVTQIVDNVMPKSRFVDEPDLPDEERQRRENRRRDLRHVIEVEADRHRDKGGLTVFATSYKGVHEKMCEQPPIPGVDWAHFGIVRGRNKWSDVAALFVHGRPQGSVGQLELDTMALFYRDPVEITCVKPNADGDRSYYVTDRMYETDDGCEAMLVKVQVHPDPRCNAVLRQIREAEIIQTLDRGRFMFDRETVCRVFILTSIPLPGVTVNRLVTAAALEPTLIQVALARGGMVPMSGPQLHVSYPDLFGSPSTARRELADFKKDMSDRATERSSQTPIYKESEIEGVLYRELTASFGRTDIQLIGVSYTLRKTASKPSFAICRADIEDPQTELGALLGKPVYALRTAPWSELFDMETADTRTAAPDSTPGAAAQDPGPDRNTVAPDAATCGDTPDEAEDNPVAARRAATAANVKTALAAEMGFQAFPETTPASKLRFNVYGETAFDGPVSATVDSVGLAWCHGPMPDGWTGMAVHLMDFDASGEWNVAQVVGWIERPGDMLG